MPSGDTWSTLIGYTTAAQFQPITDGVTDANASYMQTNPGSHEKTLVGRLKEHAFENKVSASNGDATPSVVGLSILLINQAVGLTDCDGGIDNQLLEIIATVDSVIIVHGASTIVLPGSNNITLNTNDALFLRYVTDKWYYRGLVQF